MVGVASQVVQHLPQAQVVDRVDQVLCLLYSALAEVAAESPEKYSALLDHRQLEKELLAALHTLP